jgi:Zn-dependent M28 family amino/carboxypeptidase
LNQLNRIIVKHKQHYYILNENVVNKKRQHRPEYYWKNKGKLIEFGGKYYYQRTHPKVDIFNQAWGFYNKKTQTGFYFMGFYAKIV